MKIFSMFKSANNNSSAINALDDGSDSLIASVCKFDPSNVKDEIKEKITQQIRNLDSEGNSERYNKQEVALLKLLFYYDMSNELQDIKKELETGIKHIIEMEGDSIPNRTLVKVYNRIDL